MKKILAILLAAMMLLTMVACDTGDNPDNPNKDNPGTSQNSGNNGGESQGNENNNGGGSVVNALTQAQMESEILNRLSAISELESLSLCGGSEIEYTESLTAGDIWTVSSPNKSSDDLFTSLDNQLLAVGFEKEAAVFGYDYTVKAGFNNIGIRVLYSSSGAEVKFSMTNHRGDYSQAYIDAENAKLPTIIEGLSALEKLPENFSITYLSGAGTKRTTLCRYNGGYYVEEERLTYESYDTYRFVFYYAAVPNDDGGYDYYEWDDSISLKNGNVTYGAPELVDHFVSKNTDPQKYVASCLGYGIWAEKGTASTWLKMSWDYKELALPEELASKTFYTKACAAFYISDNMTNIGPGTFLGRNTESVHHDGQITYDLTFDLETGITMKIVAQEPMNGEIHTIIYFEVTEFNMNPTSLGKFVKPAD